MRVRTLHRGGERGQGGVLAKTWLRLGRPGYFPTLATSEQAGILVVHTRLG